MFVVYILYSFQCAKSYVGYSSDLIDRFHSHNILSKSGYTMQYRPWIVIHVEFFDLKQEALNREKYYKSGRGLYKKQHIITDFLEKE